MSNKQK